MNRFADYTTDELIAMRDHVGFDSEFDNYLSGEIDFRQMLRTAWLDHCNAVAGEVIA